MYVIHLVVFFKWLPMMLSRTAPIHSHGVAYNIVAFGLVIVIAAILHFGLERPFLRLKEHLVPSRAGELDLNNLPWATVISVVLVISGFAMAMVRTD